ncbi:MAG: glycoside hydrolase family 108 protein [Roseibium sp.]|uniref:glycoside hydrolase family 108 protein n=1 Tax=Roseibium sp. TaxID=1936156 RepID=UPI001B291BF6|nr:glycoside hydrolase family 108 protein [Roseibium sp.]MBO6895226.1 glycoside hydrolase family 108 protein [Roseibium sp.]MBO6930736.1 glycoside hydrolase family 108 protein [Roseibium sp.]
MTALNFETSLAWTLVHEGGYVNHPKDPGGATNRGVIQRTYNAYRHRMGLEPQSVKRITEAEVRAIYREQYWKAVAGDALPAGVDYAVFDYGVNSGPRRAVKDLQRVVGARPDGWVGNETLAAMTQTDPQEIVQKLCKRRFRFVQGLKHWKHFGRGWTRRIMGERMGAQSDDIGVIDRGVMLARNDAVDTTAVPIPAPKAEAPGKALEEDAGVIQVVQEAAKDPKWFGIFGTFGSTIATIATSSGPVSYAVAAVLVVGGVYLVYRLERDRIAA